MRPFISLLGLLAALAISAGCATSRSTIDSRKQERASVYSSLSPEMRAMVDAGKIKVGMPMDAVYMAWGKPSQIVGGETAQGAHTTWIYEGTQLQEYRYWSSGPHYGRRHGYGSPTLESDYYPASYVQAEVNFQDGVVKQWRTLPSPSIR
ncbi:MAG: hypothetical protein JWM16_5278 [Verrucomicrobiales bacterium]|nr:hypothetical protein [Verrucomicrobiales bacterium]